MNMPAFHFGKKRFRIFAACAFAGLLCLPPAFAQESVYHKPEIPIQPFKADQLPSWLGFDGQLRGRTEDQDSLNFVPGKERLYELTRVRGGITVRPLSWLTGYMQFQDTHALGLPLRDVSSNMRNVFDLFQGYLDFHYKPVQIFAGRQELKFGDERVIGISDWTNNSRTWDGFDMRIGDKDRVDIFSTSVVMVHPSSLDTHGAGLTFHGVEANINSLLPKTSLQPFVIVHALPRVTSQQGIAGTQTEVTPGFAFETTLPRGFSASGTGDLQRGSYSNDSIHAGAAIIRGAYTAPLAWKPKLEGEYDYATGNAHTNPFRYSTYDQEYPSNHNAFGLVDLFGFQNIKQDRLSFSLAPRKNLSMLFQGGSLHVASIRDGVYSGSGSAYFKAPLVGFTHDGIGSEFDASAKYTYKKYFVTEIGVGHLFPGYVMTTSNHGAPLTLAYLQFVYRFKANE